MESDIKQESRDDFTVFLMTDKDYQLTASEVYEVYKRIDDYIRVGKFTPSRKCQKNKVDSSQKSGPNIEKSNAQEASSSTNDGTKVAQREQTTFKTNDRIRVMRDFMSRCGKNREKIISGMEGYIFKIDKKHGALCIRFDDLVGGGKWVPKKHFKKLKKIKVIRFRKGDCVMVTAMFSTLNRTNRRADETYTVVTGTQGRIIKSRPDIPRTNWSSPTAFVMPSCQLLLWDSQGVDYLLRPRKSETFCFTKKVACSVATARLIPSITGGSLPYMFRLSTDFTTPPSIAVK